MAERCPHWPNEKPVRGAHSELVQSATKFMATRGFFIQKLGKLLCLWAFTFSRSTCDIYELLSSFHSSGFLSASCVSECLSECLCVFMCLLCLHFALPSWMRYCPELFAMRLVLQLNLKIALLIIKQLLHQLEVIYHLCGSATELCHRLLTTPLLSAVKLRFHLPFCLLIC